MTDSHALEAAVKATVERFGKIDIVFANAGIAKPTPLGKTPPELFERILSTNLTAAFATVQASAPHLSRGGSIIFNGSVHATLGIPGFSAYAASKAGVRAMTRVLASELAPQGIRVNVVVPGATKTPIWNATTPDAMAALEAGMSGAIALGKLAEAEDIAHAVLFFASDDARHITAQKLVVDGGQTGAPGGAPVYRE